ncbi:MAG: DUF4184 family protein [Planctomycetota bacterium]
MPYTPTHVLAVLPLAPLYRWLPMPALAIGAMVPDIGLFFPVIGYAQTHAPLGALYGCLPFGMVIYLLFELLIRSALLELSPSWVRQRIDASPQLPHSPFLTTHLVRFACVSIAIVIGAYSHQILDAFTHEGRWGVTLVPVLEESIRVGKYSLPGYKALQYSSAIIGFPVLVALSWWWLKKTPPSKTAEPSQRSIAEWVVVILVFLLPMIIASYAWTICESYPSFAGYTVKRSGAVLMGLLVTYSVFHAWRDSRPRRRTQS